MKGVAKLVLPLAILFVVAQRSARAEIQKQVAVGNATMQFDGQRLKVSTGRMEREWAVTPRGLATVAVRGTNGFGAAGAGKADCDWSLPGTEGEANLVSLTARVSDDHRFTSRHLEVVAEFEYPATGTAVRQVIWAYPDGPGLRTQLWLKSAKPPNKLRLAAKDSLAENRVEFLPLAAMQARCVGYFNDTQNRHRPDLHLLREEVVPAGKVDWANLIAFEANRGGVVLVKESHKCANQPGVNTGGFQFGADGVSVTGAGLSAAEVRADEFRWCWATWTIVYSEANAYSRELAVKRFDRLRYPVDLERDLYTKANTWGSGGDSGIDSKAMAAEPEVLAEIDSVAELGIDALQIDDGWQVGRMPGKHPADQEWLPRPDWYPQGWSNVTAKAAARGVKLGLWLAARAPLAALEWNYDQAQFETWKLDFANLSRYDGVESYLAKTRDFISYTDHQVRVNWDVTEKAPRFGYFWARECGSIWLANRKPYVPPSTVPQPWLLLRESWELARYLNNNKFELPIQNFQRVNPAVSDAPQHSDAYAVALGLSGIPVFFQTTRLLKPEQRAQIKSLLEIYQRERRALFASFVCPIGAEPNNAAWSGFQWVNPTSNVGHLLLFREIKNQENTKVLTLNQLAGKSITLTELQSGASRTVRVPTTGEVDFTLPQPASFGFYRYETKP